MTPGEKSNLSAQLGRTLRMIDDQIEVLKERVKSDEFMDGTTIHELMDSNGQYLMTPLLIARAQVLLAITELKVTI